MLRSSLMLSVVGAVLAASPASAATINLSPFISNPSFEAGGGSTTGWVISNTPNDAVAVYQPGANQYTVGANGLSPGNPPGNNGTLPNGSSALFIPSFGGAGAGTISQVLNIKYETGTTYQWTFWVGTPNKVHPDNATGLPPGDPDANHIVGMTLVQAEFLAANGLNGNPVQAGLTGNVLNILPTLVLGQWLQYTFEFTPNAAIGQNIALRFRVDMNSLSQPHQVDFDMVIPSPDGGNNVPLPGAVWLMGSVLAGGAWIGARRRRQKNREHRG